MFCEIIPASMLLSARSCVVPVGMAVLLVVAPHALAQGGGRRGEGSGFNRPGRRAEPPKEELAGTQYSLDPDQVVEAVNRGEGPQALAYYEQLATQAEQQGRLLLAARAGHCAGLVALRLGQLRKAILVSTHSIELFRKVPAGELAASDYVRVGSAYAQLGSAHRHAGDLVRARSVLEEGCA